ncbi:AfsR/SARP family transcriptional regulator [Yinghuangia seranimata]|uniref:AfsR/SARP family transcriptional regulator n=1 Tax=Yinghuangia seranimata TaxID=408067 RepID=UPI00248C86C0|nr:AfsR/SARP family transcriptional regulator [Yinghuangia seranimata]MDI2132954.1 AfsR/SARP family transcriptional regulator [Yinghuangia seranimata]
MEIRLLGGVEACVGGTKVELGPPGQRFVLAVLALEANRVVPLQRLVELRWPDEAPPTAVHAIRAAVSRLRAILNATDAQRFDVALATRRPGYALELDPMHVDAHRFRSLVDQARRSDDEVRISLLQEAGDLWRGPALAGVGGPADALVAGLEEARLLAVEDAMDAYLRLGRHREIIHRLTDFVEAQPERERPVGQLMVALYRSGRSHEALQTYHRARKRSADQFGLEPSAELRRFELAILRDDEALLAPEPVSRPMPNEPGPASSDEAEATELARRISDRLPSADPATANVVARLLGVADQLLA